MQIVIEPADLFNPAHYAKCRRAVEVAETLPPWCYTSREFYERERERIFLKTWNCVGHVSRVPNPGSYVTETFVDIPLVIVRGEDGVIRCFVNACRHRGGEVAFGSGECKMLKCPYHTWTYALTGELVGIPLFEESDVFKKADYGLTPVRLETWAGFMWINFDAEAENLHSYLGDLPERVAPYRAEDMAMVSHTTYHIEANWKQYYENFSDPYHVPFVHRSTLNFKPVSRRQLHDPEIYKGNYVMHRAWFEGTRGVMPGEKIFPAMALPEDLQGAFYPWVYPNTGMGFAVDCVFEVEMYPEGPEHIRLERSFLVPKACQGVPDYEEILANYLRAQDQVQKEDIEILEMQQRSVHSPLYKTGRFARMDKLVHGCENWVLDRVIGNAAP